MTQRPDSYLRYANEAVFDALESLASEAAAACRERASPSPGCSASPR